MIKSNIINYLSLVKFSHTIFALPFAIIGFFMAIKIGETPFDIAIFIKVILCMIFARNAAMAYNRYADREIDEQNPRTTNREIPSGIIKPRSALVFIILNCLFFIVTTWFINRLVFFLSPIALMVILGYSMTKRFTTLCHFILGVGLGLAPIGAFLSVTGRFDIIPILLSIAVLLWVGGFDIIYALQDDDFDKSQNLKSIPVLLGRKNALHLSQVTHFMVSVLLLIVGYLLEASKFYYLGWSVFSLLLVFQHRLIKHNDLSKVNVAFFTTNGIASVTFLCFFLLDFYISW
ncbi:MAG: UbiA family prenyltransferase [Bacteroidia bacterium]|nr:UbiA family prenyltransferase [Bacteroidia bacterium]MCZ2248443.1 putative 4-hydroxybenzoate polyprenyltransferase [Bacteroidia bacterium]